METSLLVAQFLGVIYLVLGLGLLFNTGYYQKAFSGFVKDGTAMYFGGLCALVVGLLLTKYHNIWTGEWWIVFISLIGWLALIKGILIFLVPKNMARLTQPWLKTKGIFYIMVLFMLALGVIFSYYGFFA